MIEMHWAWLPLAAMIGCFIGVTITSLCVIAANRS